MKNSILSFLLCRQKEGMLFFSVFLGKAALIPC